MTRFQNQRDMGFDHSPSRTRHLLTVVHRAEPTGPPLLALHFLRWLHQHHPKWTTSTLLIDGGGSLESDFAALGPVVTAGPDFPFGPGQSPQHRAVISHKIRSVRRRVATLGPVDVCHVHCAGSMRVAPVLPNAPVLCHVHEMAVGLDLHLGPFATTYLPRADRFAVVSDAVLAALVSRFAIDTSRISRRWEFVTPDAELPELGRQELGITEEAFVVASSGVRHWRKAPELFVRTALAARHRAPEINWRFIWVGGHDSGGLHDLVRSAGADDFVQFVPHHPHPQRWFAAADAFFLPAREDAFPLVCVEAAVVGRPIVTFDNGGATELVTEGDCGLVVRFPDVDGAADALIGLARDDVHRQALGDRAQSFARRALEVSEAGPAMLEIIEGTRRARQ